LEFQGGDISTFPVGIVERLGCPGLQCCFTREFLAAAGFSGNLSGARGKVHTFMASSELPKSRTASCMASFLSLNRSAIDGDTRFRIEKVLESGFSICPVGAANSPVPIFLGHDRSGHSERQACIHILSELGGGPGGGDRVSAHDSACLFSSHTPCVSCLACLVQTWRLLQPHVKWKADFDSWGTSRSAVLSRGAG